MASIWKGSLSFGLVNIPVELRSAIQGDHISFRMLHEEDLSPIKYERVSASTGEPVPWNEIVKGYEYTKGNTSSSPTTTSRPPPWSHRRRSRSWTS